MKKGRIKKGTGTGILSAPSGRVRLSDLGRILGVDKSSVSLALSGSPKVSEETRRRVKAAAIKYGYRPNLVARHLRTGQAHMIGLLFPGSFETLNSTVAVRTIQAIARNLGRKGVIFSIISSRDYMNMNKSGTGAPYIPDGLLVWGDVPLSEAKAVNEYEIPSVVLDPNNESYRGFKGPCVKIDNFGGITGIVSHIIRAGARRMLFVGVQKNHIGHEERWNGARKAWMEKMSLHTATFCSIDEITDEILSAFSKEKGGAIICSNDSGAMKVWHLLNKIPINVPDQVFLTGFDDDGSGEEIGLSTAIFNCDKFADTACELILDMINGGKMEKQKIIPVKIKKGKT